MEKKGFHAPDRKRAMQFLEYRRQRLIERGDNASERPPTDTDERESSVRAALEQESSATVRSSRESQQGLEREGVLDAFSMVFERQHEGRSHKAVGEHSGQVTRKSVQSVETGGSGTESTSVEGGSNKQVTPTPCLTQGDLVNTTYNSPASCQSAIDNTNLSRQTCSAHLPFLVKAPSAHPLVGPAFCDGLANTFSWPGCDDISTLMEVLKDAANLNDSGWALLPFVPHDVSPYRIHRQLLDSYGQQVALLQFHPKSKKTNFARLEFNPVTLGVEGLVLVKRILRLIVGKGYKTVLADGLVTKLHITVDVEKTRPSDHIVFSDRSRTSSLWQRVFGKEGQEECVTETLYIGSETSDYFVRVYDKAAQLWRVKGTVLDDLRMRIEAHTSPRKEGKSVALRDLKSINNPLARIHVAAFPDQDADDPFFFFFLCAVRMLGAEEALRRLNGKNIAKRAAYRRRLCEYEEDWWNPEKFWQEFLVSLDALGLLPGTVRLAA